MKSELFHSKLHNINSIVHHSWQSYVKSRRKGEKGHMWSMCKVNLVPRIFYLSPSKEEEREPWERGWCKVTFRGLVYRWKNSVAFQMSFGIKSGFILYSADLYLIAQTIRGNHDIHSRDRRGLACVAWRFWSGALSNMGGRGQRNREEIGAGACRRRFCPVVLVNITA